MKKRITKRVADSVSPAAKDIFIWDCDVPGFGLKITPSGRRSYVLQYRLGGRKGVTKRLSLGQHGVVTAEEARSEAKKLLGIVAHREDPAERRVAQKGSAL